MNSRTKVVFCWSGGKDSALALNRLRQDDRFEIVSLLTTCNERFQRVSMHGVRLELLEAQARSIGLPLEKVFVGEGSTNDEYERRMGTSLRAFKVRGVTTCVFGDIFLEDLKCYREANLAKIGMRACFPLWKEDTRALIDEFIRLGFGSVVCCANDGWLDESAVGRCIDRTFVDSLPAGVDPCGEHGEYHSFAFAGPIFQSPVRYRVGEVVYRPLDPAPIGTSVHVPQGGRPTKGFWFRDLLPA